MALDQISPPFCTDRIKESKSYKEMEKSRSTIVMCLRDAVYGASFDSFFDFRLRISPLSDNPSSPVSCFDSKRSLCTQSTLQATNALDLIYKHSSLLCLWSAPNRVDRFPCVASKLFQFRLLLQQATVLFYLACLSRKLQKIKEAIYTIVSN